MTIINKGKSIYIDYDYKTELNKIIRQWIISEFKRGFYKQNLQN